MKRARWMTRQFAHNSFALGVTAGALIEGRWLMALMWGGLWIFWCAAYPEWTA